MLETSAQTDARMSTLGSIADGEIIIPMNCPCCRNSLIEVELYGELVDRCRFCGGLWLDPTELGSLVRQGSAPTSIDGARRRCTNGLRCPKCNHAMAPVQYAHDSGVYINKCLSCEGSWLEPGQLELLIRYRIGTPATQALANAWDDKLRRSNNLRFTRELLRSRLLSGGTVLAFVLFVFVDTGELQSAILLAASFLLPLVCIWFADIAGDLKRISFGIGRPTITRSTPGDFVAIGGWILLLSRIAVLLWLRE